MSTDRNTMDAWSGRVDPEPDSPRWHQVIGAFADPTAASTPGAVLLGFACDEGVRRNKGRTGAAAAPA
ncbi:formimidoylglutamase, partial [Thauera phenylacetica B4P]